MWTREEEEILQAVSCNDFGEHTTFFNLLFAGMHQKRMSKRTEAAEQPVGSYQGGRGYYSDPGNNTGSHLPTA